MLDQKERWAIFWCSLLSPVLYGEIPQEEVGRFLTDLTSRDIILGKLAASSLHGIFGLLAVFPILGLPLLLVFKNFHLSTPYPCQHIAHPVVVAHL